ITTLLFAWGKKTERRPVPSKPAKPSSTPSNRPIVPAEFFGNTPATSKTAPSTPAALRAATSKVTTAAAAAVV
ncbi:hypothetical protein PFISCL1PPCAC_10910, partial [Pristionchus fissidentatus]